MFADDMLKNAQRQRREMLATTSRAKPQEGWSDDVCTMPFAGPVWIKTDRGHAIVAEHVGFGNFQQIGVRPNKYKPRINTNRTIFITEIVAWARYEEPAD